MGLTRQYRPADTLTVGELADAMDEIVTGENDVPGVPDFQVVFVNSDSGHRYIGTVEVNPASQTVYLYESDRKGGGPPSPE